MDRGCPIKSCSSSSAYDQIRLAVKPTYFWEASENVHCSARYREDVAEMSVECFSNKNGQFIHATCTLSQTCCEGQCCDKDFDYKFYTHWYFWVAVTVFLLLVLGAIISGYCHHCRKTLPCPACGIFKTLGLNGRSNLVHCAWVWSLDEDKNPSTFLGYQIDKAPQSPTSLTDQESAMLCSPKPRLDDVVSQSQSQSGILGVNV